MTWEAQSEDALVNRIMKKLGLTDVEAVEAGVADIRQFFLNHTHQPEVPEEANGLLYRIAILWHNREGNEGVLVEEYSGISTEFLEDLPPDIRMELVSFRRLRW